jgi:hypothetical protein
VVHDPFHVQVKRRDHIRRGEHKPVAETGLLKGSAAPPIRFTVIHIGQRYPGHARNVLRVASSCMAGAYNGNVQCWWTMMSTALTWTRSCGEGHALRSGGYRAKAWSSGRETMFAGELQHRHPDRRLACPTTASSAANSPVVDVQENLRWSAYNASSHEFLKKRL